MKRTLTLTSRFICLFLLTSILFACGGKKEDTNPQELIAGSDSKVWVAKKELNAAGDKEKMTGEEKDQRMTFYRNGKFSIQGNADQQGGTWHYDAGAKTLSLDFADASMREVFDVQDIDNNEMKVKAADGSTMIMKAD